MVEPGQTQPEPERPEPTLLAQPADTAQGKIDIEPESVVPDSAAQDTIAAPLTQPADTAQGKSDIQPESAVPDSAVQDTIAAPQEPQAPPEDNTEMAIPSETEISGPDSTLQDTGTVVPAPADTLSPQ